MGPLKATLAAVLERYVLALDALGLAAVESDPEWASPCEIGPPDEDGWVRWRPAAVESAPDFSAPEAALGVPLHPDLKTFYGSYWSAPVEARRGDEAVLLQTVWNPEDLARTRQAIVSHVLSRREALGGGDTVFVGSTDSDLFWSVDNATGEVLLEEPGRPPRGVAAPSLNDFLAALRVGAEQPRG